MVSGLVTSPWDQLRIFSGDARLMRMASKSAMVFCISNGLERNKVFLRFPRQCRCRLRPSLLVLSSQLSAKPGSNLAGHAALRANAAVAVIQKNSSFIRGSRSHSQPQLRTENREPGTGNWFHQSAAALAVGFFSPALISSTSRQSDCNSRISTLNDSGTPGSMAASPLTMAS